MQRALLPALLSLTFVWNCGVEDSNLLGSGTLAQVQTCDTTNGDLTPHWEPAQRCIAVSYEPSLSPHLAGLQAGLEAWSKVTCSRLCFEAPEAIDRGDSVVPTGWIHFRPSASSDDRPRQAELRYRQDSGKVLNAVVSISVDRLNELPPETQRGTWAAAVGEGLGLPPSQSGPSALATFSDDLVAEPTAEDAQVFCGFYGPGGICALLP